LQDAGHRLAPSSRCTWSSSAAPEYLASGADVLSPPIPVWQHRAGQAKCSSALRQLARVLACPCRGKAGFARRPADRAAPRRASTVVNVSQLSGTCFSWTARQSRSSGSASAHLFCWSRAKPRLDGPAAAASRRRGTSDITAEFISSLAASPQENAGDPALPPQGSYRQRNDVSFLAARSISPPSASSAESGGAGAAQSAGGLPNAESQHNPD
jgi:hypothetical protein